MKKSINFKTSKFSMLNTNRLFSFEHSFEQGNLNLDTVFLLQILDMVTSYCYQHDNDMVYVPQMPINRILKYT